MTYDARHHPASDAEKRPDQGFSWEDPHHFHPGDHDPNNPHSAHEHHVSSWQLNVVILFVLLFFTVLTVVVAKGEVILTTYTDFPITQLWNVIIAMAIATVKAMLVCMYFMHLRHDKALNTMVLLFTFATLGMFMAMPAIDIGSREAVKGYGLEPIVPGGSGVGMSRWNGEDISGSIVEVSRQDKIAEVGEEKYWKKFYDYKLHYKHKVPYRHKADEKDIHAKWLAAGGAHHGDHADGEHHTPFGLPETSTANRRVVRTGLTPGLFDATAGSPPPHEDDHGGHDHPELDHDTPESDQTDNTDAPADGNQHDSDAVPEPKAPEEPNPDNG